MKPSLVVLPLALVQAATCYIPVGLDDALTGHNVPEKFLEVTYLAGKFPLIASRVDPRVSYSVYVPPEHYHPGSNSTQGGEGKKLPLLVDVHGTSRSIDSMLNEDDLPAFADGAACAVLAPLFPAGLEGPNDVDSYKVLRTDTLRSDLVLLSILDEVAYRWPGVDTTSVYMSGFSGGGQFAHRFMYLHPDRLRGVSVGAPGSVTLLDQDEEWPQGIADTADLFNVTVDKSRIRDIPIQLVIGDQDTKVPGGLEFWKWAKEALGSNAPMPLNQSRIEVIQGLRASWKDDGIDSELVVVPGVGHEHSAPGVRAAVKAFIGGLLKGAK